MPVLEEAIDAGSGGGGGRGGGGDGAAVVLVAAILMTSRTGTSVLGPERLQLDTVTATAIVHGCVTYV